VDEKDKISTPLGCVSCSDCLMAWIITQTQELYYRNYGKISCINAKCKEQFTIEEVFSKFTLPQQEQINTALLSVYINKTADIRRCPNQKCSYSGIIASNASCKEFLECAMCKTLWREKGQLSSLERVKGFYSSNSSERSDLMSEVWEEMWSRRCPNCYVNIEKSGGCNHMKCGKCNFSFCWLCTQPEAKHNSDLCLISIATKLLIILLPLLHLFMMIGLERLIAWLFMWLSTLLVNGLILNSFLISIYMIFKSVFSGCVANKLFSFVPFFMILFVLNSLNMYRSLMYTAIFEMLALGVLIFGRFSINKWRRKVK